MKFANATKFYRKSGEAEGSAVPRTSRGNAEYYAQIKLSSRPERGVGSHADSLAPAKLAL